MFDDSDEDTDETDDRAIPQPTNTAGKNSCLLHLSEQSTLIVEMVCMSEALPSILFQIIDQSLFS